MRSPALKLKGQGEFRILSPNGVAISICLLPPSFNSLSHAHGYMIRRPITTCLRVVLTIQIKVSYTRRGSSRVFVEGKEVPRMFLAV